MENSLSLKGILSSLPESERTKASVYIINRFLLQYNESGSTLDLETAIAISQSSVALMGPLDPHRVDCLSLFGYALQKRFQCLGSLEDLEYAIQVIEEALTLRPADDPQLSEQLINLANWLRARFTIKGSIQDLDRAIKAMDRAVAVASRDDDQIAIYLSQLGNILACHSEATGSPQNIDRAISVLANSIAMTPDDHPNAAMFLSNLGNALQIRFEQRRDLSDLNQAVSTMQRAVSLTQANHSRRASRLNILASALLLRFKQTWNMEDTNTAVELIQTALNSDGNSLPDIAIYYNNLGLALQNRFERTGSIDNLNRAVEALEKACATSDHSLDTLGHLTNLGYALRLRFDHTGSLQDLDVAIETLTTVVTLTPPDHSMRPGRLNNLGTALLSRFECLGCLDDLDHAIETMNDAVNLTPEGSPDLALSMSNLGNAVQNKFDRTGSISDLDRAITINEQAISITSDENPLVVTLLNNLSLALQSRSQKLGSTTDLQHAVDTLRKAITLAPQTYADLPHFYNNLSKALQGLYERTRSISYLDEAIVQQEKAVDTSTLNHPNQAGFLNNLGLFLVSRYGKTESTANLERGIEMIENALAITPGNHPDRAVYLSNLSATLQRKYESQGSVEIINAAISRAAQALALTEQNHAKRAIRLTILSSGLEKRFRLLGHENDLTRIIEASEQVVRMETAPSILRINSARFAADLLLQNHTMTDKVHALSLLRMAVELLSTLSPRSLHRSDQQQNLSQFAGMTSTAVSLSLICEDPPRALELMEMGRGILEALQLEVRSDVSILTASHPALAEQFLDIRDRIHASQSLNLLERTESHALYREDRHALASSFSNLLAEIRKLQSFERFLLGPSDKEMISSASSVPIVIFNASELRADAFIVSIRGIEVVQLPKMTFTDLRTKTMEFLEAVDGPPSQYYERTKTLTAVLTWLWDVAMERVLDTLGYIRPPLPGMAWPKIWWIGGGLLSILPIHAAGYHQAGSSASVIDRVISSYATTIKALIYAQKRRQSVGDRKEQNLLFVAMPTTPGKRVLPNVLHESEQLKKLLPTSIHVTILENPNADMVISQIPAHQIFHLAGHGASMSDPSLSTLFLEDWIDNPLTVSRLVSVKSGNAELAFLSACHSASAREVRLLDESINLCAAVQLSGFPAVVGTLWAVEDMETTILVNDFYTTMLEGSNTLQTTRSSESLHNAVRLLRERTCTVPGFKRRNSPNPLIWAAYIHIGV